MPTTLHTLTNPLLTPSQLQTSSSSLDAIPPALERSLRYNASLLTLSASILLHLDISTAARATTTLQRFFTGPEGGSFLTHDIPSISAAAVYLAAKLSASPVSPRSVLAVHAYLTSPASTTHGQTKPESEQSNQESSQGKPEDPTTYTLSEGTYLSQRQTLFQNEALLLRTLGYTTSLITPYPLALTYLQTLSLLPSTPTKTSTALAARVLALLNSALLSPQLLFLTHQPHALAVAAVYLAARETGIKVAGSWWEVFDVGREELGFLVVGMRSVEGWCREEGGLGKGCWGVRDVEVETGRLR